MDIEKLKDSNFQEKLKNAESAEDILEQIKEQGMELSDEQLEAVSGGSWDSTSTNPTCPYCGSTNSCKVSDNFSPASASEQGALWKCQDCGETFNR